MKAVIGASRRSRSKLQQCERKKSTKARDEFTGGLVNYLTVTLTMVQRDKTSGFLPSSTILCGTHPMDHRTGSADSWKPCCGSIVYGQARRCRKITTELLNHQPLHSNYILSNCYPAIHSNYTVVGDYFLQAVNPGPGQ